MKTGWVWGICNQQDRHDRFADIKDIPLMSAAKRFVMGRGL